MIQWPPPPRTTPIIVPPHLRDTTSTSGSTTPMDSNNPSKFTTSKPKSKPKTKSNTKAKSSLHRAVMERLQVQRAMGDLEPGKLT